MDFMSVRAFIALSLTLFSHCFYGLENIQKIKKRKK